MKTTTALPTPCREWAGYRKPDGYGIRDFHDGFSRRVHRWVMEQVEGKLPRDVDVMHLCDNPPCFRFDHLALGSRTENMRDAQAKGRLVGNQTTRGEAVPSSKLTEEDVREIRRLRSEGVGLRTIADQFGIAMTNASMVARGVTWRHVV